MAVVAPRAADEAGLHFQNLPPQKEKNKIKSPTCVWRGHTQLGGSAACFLQFDWGATLNVNARAWNPAVLRCRLTPAHTGVYFASLQPYKNRWDPLPKMSL